MDRGYGGLDDRVCAIEARQVSVWDGGYPDQPEDEREQDYVSADPDGWRGNEHPEGWPEDDYLGGEYGLYKRDSDSANEED